METNQFEINRASFINALWNIREEKYWCQGSSIIRLDGEPVRCCSMGAFTLNDDHFSYVVGELDEYAMQNRLDDVVRFNDSHTYQEVIDLWVKLGVSKGYLPAGFTMDQLETLRNSL